MAAAVESHAADLTDLEDKVYLLLYPLYSANNFDFSGPWYNSLAHVCGLALFVHVQCFVLI